MIPPERDRFSTGTAEWSSIADHHSGRVNAAMHTDRYHGAPQVHTGLASWRLVKRCKLEVAGSRRPPRSLSRSFLVRISQKARVARAARMRIGRPEMVHACIHSHHKRKRVPCLYFHGSGAVPNPKLPRSVGPRACAGSMHHACQRVEWNEPPARACRVLASIEPQEYVYHGTAHQRRTWRTSLSPPYRTCRFATVYSLREWCGVRAVMCTCAQYSTKPFARVLQLASLLEDLHRSCQT